MAAGCPASHAGRRPVVVDLDPVAVRILQVDLAKAVAVHADAAGIARPVGKGNAECADVGNEGVEIGGGDGDMRLFHHMRRAEIAGDEVDRIAAADFQPGDIGAAFPRDRLETKDVPVERDAALEVAHQQCNMVEAVTMAHNESSGSIALSCRAATWKPP
jgi:hypothetical protein